MKSVDHALDRLFRAAARARTTERTAEPTAECSPEAEGTEVMPAALQTRILASRREWLARRASEEFVAILALIRRGLAAAALVAIVTAVICHRGDDGRVPSVESMVLQSVAELSLLPDSANP